MLAFILVASSLAYVVWSLACLELNYRRARSLQIPLVRLPIDGHNVLFQVLGDLIWAAIARLGLKPFLPQWTVYARRGWNFEDKARTAKRLGKVWALVTPVGIYVELSDADAIHDVVTRRLDFPRPTKSYEILEVFGPCISTAGGDDWARHRKALAAPFNERIMSYVWSESLQQTSDMAHAWTTHGIKSYAKDARTISLNILAATGFKKPFAFRPTGEEENRAELSYRDALQIILDNIIMLLVLRPRLLTSRLLPHSLQRIGRAAAAFKVYMAQMLEEEMTSLHQGGSGSGSLMTSLVRAGDSYAKSSDNAKGKTTGLSVDEIFGNIFVINFAGHDTTANTLAFSMLLLAAHPDIQDWLAQEVKQATNGVRVEDWDYSELFPKLVRVRALMYEVLRFFPPIMVILKGPPKVTQSLHVQGRDILISPDIEINGHVLAVHLDPAYYFDPHAFKPRRWIKPATNNDQESFIPPRKGAYLAWAEGPQICPGLKFSQVEFVAVMAFLMSRYRLEAVRLNGESEDQLKSRVMGVLNDCDAQLLLRMKNADSVKLRCVVKE